MEGAAAEGGIPEDGQLSQAEEGEERVCAQAVSRSHPPRFPEARAAPVGGSGCIPHPVWLGAVGVVHSRRSPLAGPGVGRWHSNELSDLASEGL